MQVFIYVELLDKPSYSYQKPVLNLVKQSIPGMIYLDVDSFSDDFLVTQACQLLEQATVSVVYFKSASSEAKIGSLVRFAETLIRIQNEKLIVVQGQHNRLERVFSNRSNLNLLNNPDERYFTTQLISFLN